MRSEVRSFQRPLMNRTGSKPCGLDVSAIDQTLTCRPVAIRTCLCWLCNNIIHCFLIRTGTSDWFWEIGPLGCVRWKDMFPRRLWLLRNLGRWTKATGWCLLPLGLSLLMSGQHCRWFWRLGWMFCQVSWGDFEVSWRQTLKIRLDVLQSELWVVRSELWGTLKIRLDVLGSELGELQSELE